MRDHRTQKMGMCSHGTPKFVFWGTVQDHAPPKCLFRGEITAQNHVRSQHPKWPPYSWFLIMLVNSPGIPQWIIRGGIFSFRWKVLLANRFLPQHHANPAYFTLVNKDVACFNPHSYFILLYQTCNQCFLLRRCVLVCCTTTSPPASPSITNSRDPFTIGKVPSGMCLT